MRSRLTSQQPDLRAGPDLNQDPSDSLWGGVPTLVSGMTTDVVYCLEGNTVDRDAAQNGRGWSKCVCPTLNVQDKHAVCYAVDCRNLYLNKELSATLQAKENGGFSLNYTNPVLVKREE